MSLRILNELLYFTGLSIAQINQPLLPLFHKPTRQHIPHTDTLRRYASYWPQCKGFISQL